MSLYELEQRMRMSEYEGELTPVSEMVSTLKAQLEAKDKEIKELAEALDGAADAFAWFNKTDFELTYRNIANKHLEVKGE